MNRRMMQSLIDWKDSANRKPLLFQGARQVGKTWLLEEFGRTHFRHTAYINFDQSSSAQRIFDGDFDLTMLLTRLQLACGQPIHPESTLLILDEIQEAPRAITSLKYFCEQAPQYHIAAAGSYLGVASLKGTGFPIGKVNTLTLHPMSFLEFLEAVGQERLAHCVRESDWATLAIFRERLIEHLRYYQIVGGMPEAVKSFAENRDFHQVRGIQRDLLKEYDRDFGKHTPQTIVPSIRMVWNSVPAQLARENRKFQLSKLQRNARKDDFAPAIQWLCDAGLLHQVHRISKPAFPLAAYLEEDAFKLFFLDLGEPPLVTPSSQIVGTQAVLNVLMGERYKVATKETKSILLGEYGQTVKPFNPEVVDKVLGPDKDKAITCRPADLIEPELDKIEKEMSRWKQQDEDVLTYALFPQQAVDFFKFREAQQTKVDPEAADYENGAYPV